MRAVQSIKRRITTRRERESGDVVTTVDVETLRLSRWVLDMTFCPVPALRESREL
jgi:hypothetical protein